MPYQSRSREDHRALESIKGSGKFGAAIGVADHSANVSAKEYSGVVLSSASQVRGLRNSANRLMQTQNTMLSPEFFLASLPEGWRPKVVAVYSARDVIGVLYAKERIIKGFPTGIVYADGSLGGVLLADHLYHRCAFRVAAETLLASSGIRGMRLRILHSSRDFDAVLQLTASKSLDIEYSPVEDRSSPLWKNHAHLGLADTYDDFLKTLGSTTRHNFRYYRRRFEASGHKFVEHLSLDELSSASLALFPKSKLTARAQQKSIDWQLKRVAAASRPLAVGLKHHSGEWLSVLGGWYMPGGALLSFQYNNEENFSQDSLSIVLRAYLIELLIRQRLKELVIWADTGPPLSRYVYYPPAIDVRLDITARSWRVARLLISAVGPRLPKPLAAVAQWVA